MSVRVCPICDKKMKYAHFCTNCKAYIKEPVFWNRTYNLNGDGGQSAILNQCENHDHSRENATGKVRTDYNTTAAKTSAGVQRQRQAEQQRREQGRIEQQRTGQQRSKQQGQEYRQSTGDNRLNRKKNPIFIIIFIYIMIQVLLSITAGIFSLF